jgi:hypothetical protein
MAEGVSAWRHFEWSISGVSSFHLYFTWERSTYGFGLIWGKVMRNLQVYPEVAGILSHN